MKTNVPAVFCLAIFQLNKNLLLSVGDFCE